MTPPTREEILQFITMVHKTEGLGVPDDVMVDAVAHAFVALDLSVRSMSDTDRVTAITLAAIAFTYGQNATALRLSEWWNRRGDEPSPAEDEHQEFVNNIPDDEVTTNDNFEVEPDFHAWAIDEIERMRKGERPFPPLPKGGEQHQRSAEKHRG